MSTTSSYICYPRFLKRPLRASLVVAIAAVAIASCAAEEQLPRNRIILGIVAYGEGNRSVERFNNFRDYLAAQTNSVVELEPAFNEIKALSEIRRRRWSLVFAPPGLAATAIAKAQYEPLFPLQGSSNTVRSVMVVREDSPVQTLLDLQGQTIALGQPGSATGYYLPLYDLFGMTLREIHFDSVPKDTLSEVATGQAVAGALSKDEYDDYRSEFSPTEFRIIHTSRNLPSGVVLVGASVDRNLQRYIVQAMNAAPPNLASEVGYIPNADPPNYDFFIDLTEKIEPYEQRARNTPAVLYPPAAPAPTEAPPREQTLDIEADSIEDAAESSGGGANNPKDSEIDDITLDESVGDSDNNSPALPLNSSDPETPNN